MRIIDETIPGTTEVVYPIKDHLNTIHAFVDSNGNIAEQYTYDAWGKVLSIKNGSGTSISKSNIGNRYLWQGREYSFSTGLYYFRARWYEPITGRWLSNDPIGISGGHNLYEFCSSNPINNSDPFGLDVEVWGATGSFVAGMGIDVTFGVAISENDWSFVCSYGADAGVGFGAGGTYQRYEGDSVKDIRGHYRGWSAGLGPFSGGRAYDSKTGKSLGIVGDYQKGLSKTLLKRIGGKLSKMLNVSAFVTLEGETAIFGEHERKKKCSAEKK